MLRGFWDFHKMLRGFGDFHKMLQGFWDFRKMLRGALNLSFLLLSKGVEITLKYALEVALWQSWVLVTTNAFETDYLTLLRQPPQSARESSSEASGLREAI